MASSEESFTFKLLFDAAQLTKEAQAAEKALKDMGDAFDRSEKAAKKSQKSIESYEKSVKVFSGPLGNLIGDIEDVGEAFGTAGVAALGAVTAFAAVGAGMTALGKAAIEANKHLKELGLLTGTGGISIDKFSSASDRLKVSLDKLLVTVSGPGFDRLTQFVNILDKLATAGDKAAQNAGGFGSFIQAGVQAVSPFLGTSLTVAGAALDAFGGPTAGYQNPGSAGFGDVKSVEGTQPGATIPVPKKTTVKKTTAIDPAVIQNMRMSMAMAHMQHTQSTAPGQSGLSRIASNLNAAGTEATKAADATQAMSDRIEQYFDDAAAKSAKLQDALSNVSSLLSGIGNLTSAVGDLITQNLGEQIDAIDAHITKLEKRRDKALSNDQKALNSAIASGSKTLVAAAAEQYQTDKKMQQQRIKEAEERERALLKKQFKAQQAAAIASIAFSAGQAAIAALAPPPVGAGPVFGPALAGIALATAGVQVGTVLSQKPPQFPMGGVVGLSADHQLAGVRPTEGVVTENGLAGLGGPDGLNQLNRGGGAGDLVIGLQLKPRQFEQIARISRFRKDGQVGTKSRVHGRKTQAVK